MVTNELLLQKIKEQINEAEKLVNEPTLFTERLKRVEILCELVTEDNSKQQSSTKVTPEMLKPTNQATNKQVSPESSSNSIFDF